jgi:hypothetical protein
VGFRGGLRIRVRPQRRFLGNGVNGSDREPAHEAELRNAEERLLATERRIRQLKGHAVALRKIEDLVGFELKS